MIVFEKPLKKAEIIPSSDIVFDGIMIKGVVDIKKGLLAIDSELHADLEQYLLGKGSAQEDLWGINLYPGEDEDFIEFDSVINIRPHQNNRSRSVESPEIRQKITEIISKWIN